MIKSTSVVLLGAAFLASCNLAPTYVRPQGAVPDALPVGGVYPAADLAAPDITQTGWAEFFVDPRLREVIAEGLANNRDLRAASANVLAARARYGVARADRLPTIALTGSATYTDNAAQGAAAGETPGSDVELYTAEAGVSAFELDLFGRVRNLDQAALQQYFASEEGQRAARISLIAEIASTWLTLAADQDQLRLSRDVLGSFEQTRDLTQAQFRIGVVSELEARQADVQYQGARNDIAVLETRVAQDINALELLVGAPVARERLPTGLPQAATLDRLPNSLSSEVLLRRPDVLQAERLLESEYANIGAARAALFPTLSLTASQGSTSSDLADLFSDGSFAYGIIPSLTLPIFDSGRRSANVRVAEAQQQAALATYEKSIQAAFREVADALAQRGTLDTQVQSQSARAESAQAAAQIAGARYRVGVSSFLVALDAQRTAYGAQQLLVSTQLSRAANSVELYRALGGGLQ